MLKVLYNHFKNSLHTARILSKNKEIRIIRFFIIFYIRFFYSFSFLRNLIKSSTNQTSKNYNISSFEKSENINDIVSKINNHGYYINLIKKEKFNEIYKLIKIDDLELKSKSFTKEVNYDLKQKNTKRLNDIINTSLKEQISFLPFELKIKKNTNIYKLVMDGYLKEIASAYLNSSLLTVKTELFISNHVQQIDEITKKNNAQYYHYDCDYKKFLKVFIYLNEVDEFNGPHSFVINTHKSKKIEHLVAERLDDDEVIKKYGKQKIINFQGPQGTIIFEDTFGLHKGTFPISGSRAVLIIEYGIGSRISYSGNELIL